ncbi:MAG: GNAT family N-acetyltransferase [Candidatus Hodarchaeota archaeon]
MNINQLNNPKRISEDEIEAASKVLGRSFQDDPLFMYCFPDPIERKIKVAIHGEWLILLGILSGEVYITSSNIERVAIWHPHGIKDQLRGTQSKEIRTRLRKVRKMEFSDPLVIERMSNFEDLANSFQSQYVNFPHWYLAFIGIDPVHQSKGYASKLIRMKLTEIDEQNLPCYLHTENEKNVKFYEYFGFKLIGKNNVPNSDFYHHPMLRNSKMKSE